MKTREQIIIDAFRKLGIPGDGDVITNAQNEAGVNALSSMLRTFQAKHGLPLWKTSNMSFAMSLFTDGQATMGVGETLATTDKPLKVKGVWREDATNATYPHVADMQRYTREEFSSLGNPNVVSAPTVVYADERKDTIIINLWPRPDAYWVAGGNVILTVTTEFTGPANKNATPDFPDHWEEAVIYGLAVRLAPEYGYALTDRAALKQEAKDYIEEALSFDNEEGSIFIQPTRNFRSY